MVTSERCNEVAAEFGDQFVAAEDALRLLEARCAETRADWEAAGSKAEEAREVHAEAAGKLADIEAQMTEVMAADREAKDQVAGMTRTQLNEVKALKGNPPAQVRRALESVWVVLHSSQWSKGDASLRSLDLSKDWFKVQKMLTRDGFVQSVIDFDTAQLDLVPWVVDYLVERYFSDLSLPCLAASAGEAPEPIPLCPATSSGSGADASEDPPPAAPRRASTGSLATSSSSRMAGSATLQSAGRASIGGGRTSTQASTQARGSGAAAVRSQLQGPLDIVAVERASKASGVLVRWCLQVVREFVVLRTLRAERLRAETAAAAAAATAEECDARAQEREAEFIKACQARDAAQEELDWLRREAEEAARALRELARLQQVQDEFAPVCQARSGTLAPQKPPREGKDLEMPAVGDLMKMVQAMKEPAAQPPPAAPAPEPTPAAPARREVEDEPESDEDGEVHIVIDSTAPLPLPPVAPDGSLAVPAPPPPPKAPAEDVEVECEIAPAPPAPPPWWVEFGYNEREVSNRATPQARLQRKACEALGKHLSKFPDTVVFLEGFSSGQDEDPGVAAARAAGCASWLQQLGIPDGRVRLSLPAPADLVAAVATPGEAEEGEVGGVEKAEEEDDGEETDEEEEEEGGTTALPERRVMATPLREVRTLQGPSLGDAGRAGGVGIFFAPEDASLTSMGSGAKRILKRAAKQILDVFRTEGRKHVLIEGHADEGIQDEYLLNWLSTCRAENVKAYLLEIAGEPPPAEAAAERPGSKDGKAPCPSAPASGASSAPPGPRAASKADPRLVGRAGSKDGMVAGAEKDGVEEEEEELFFWPEELVICSRGKTCQVTAEWGYRSLNRRVNLFLLDRPAEARAVPARM